MCPWSMIVNKQMTQQSIGRKQLGSPGNLCKWRSGLACGRRQLGSPGNLCCSGGVVWRVADIRGVCITAPTTKLLYSCRRQASSSCSYSEAVCVIVPWVIAVLAQQRMEGGLWLSDWQRPARLEVELWSRALAWHDSTLSRMACQALDSRLERVSPIVMMDPLPNWSILEYLMVSCRL